MSKTVKQFFAEDGATLLKVEETQIMYHSTDINKVIKKTTNYNLDGKIVSREETEEFFNTKTGEKINKSNNSGNTNTITIASLPVFGYSNNIAIHPVGINVVHPNNGIYHNFGSFLRVNYPNMFLSK